MHQHPEVLVTYANSRSPATIAPLGQWLRSKLIWCWQQRLCVSPAEATAGAAVGRRTGACLHHTTCTTPRRHRTIAALNSRTVAALSLLNRCLVTAQLPACHSTIAGLSQHNRWLVTAQLLESISSIKQYPGHLAPQCHDCCFVCGCLYMSYCCFASVPSLRLNAS